MIHRCNWLVYKLPKRWRCKKDNEKLFLYHPNGEGAVTISLLSIENTDTPINVHLSIISKSFIDKNNIKLSAPLILRSTESKSILSGIGTTEDGGYIKLSIVAKHRKIVLATYLSECENQEVKDFDFIIDSMRFSFLF